jgi:hypothetical protein
MSDPKKLANALKTLAPAMDLVGPTAADDIRRAITRYGADAVKAAVRDATRAKRGRKLEPDLQLLADVFKDDARKWLAGGDPFAERTNYAIAKEFAERHPGQSAVSTHQRIERKLAKDDCRRWVTLATAESLSRGEFPYTAHLRALEALSALPPSRSPDIWQNFLDRARAKIADYEVREGKTPAATMTMKQIEDAVEQSTWEAIRPQKVATLGSLLLRLTEKNA